MMGRSRRLGVLRLWPLLLVLVLAGCGGGELEPRRDEPSLASTFDSSRRVEPALTHAVARMTGRRIEVRCWPGGEWEAFADETARENGLPGASHILGVADSATTTIHLAPRVCAILSSFLLDPALPAPGAQAVELVQGLVTVGHEAGHLTAGYEEEASAECFGLQHVTTVAEALGATEADAGLLASFYWTEVYPFIDEQYRSPACRDGGPLDIDPSHVWP